MKRRIKKDFKKDLENTARQMILVTRVNTLIKLVLRTIMRKIGVKNTGMFLYDKVRDEYVINVSRGQKGIKVPAGFAKITKKSPIIRCFLEKNIAGLNEKFIGYRKIDYLIKKYRKQRSTRSLSGHLEDLKAQMDLYNARVCIPGFFRDQLIAVIFLGDKKDKTSLNSDELSFLSVLASDVVMAIQNTWLIEDLERQLEENKKIFFGAVSALGAAIESKDRYTGGHTERVVTYVVEIAENIRDYENNIKIDDWQDFRDNLIVAALLHDIGKIGIPEKILNKKGALTDKERELIVKHPMLGIDILDPIKQYEDAISGIKYHHERYDGTGYPFKLKGDKIPLIASIISVADAFDAMTTNRSYRKALSREEAVMEIKRNRGKQFHPYIVDAFLRAQGV